MTDKRATIILSGDVQDAGFRGIVMRLAQKSGLVGYVENMPDGSVRAICEGEEKSIKAFSKKLDIRNGDVSVEKVDIKWSNTQGKFKYFEVKYSDLGAEMFQGFATAGRMLGDVRREVSSVKDEVSSVKDEVSFVKDEVSSVKDEVSSVKDEVSFVKDEVRIVGQKVDSMHDDMNTRFDTLDTKYGEIGVKMTSLENNIGDLTWQIKRLVDHVVGEEEKKDSE